MNTTWQKCAEPGLSQNSSHEFKQGDLFGQYLLVSWFALRIARTCLETISMWSLPHVLARDDQAPASTSTGRPVPS